LILPRKFKSPLVEKIIKIYKHLGTDELKFGIISDHLGDAPSAIAGVLSSYPAVFAKAQQVRTYNFDTGNSNKSTMWRLIPEGEVDDNEIMELYGFGTEAMSELSVDGGMRYKWISAKRLDNGKFSRRDVHYLMHHFNKDNRKPLKHKSLSQSSQ
tara:strand:- start:246 stop:710 length:465 start_codon:yes stop_codon:yes gene_type:complete